MNFIWILTRGKMIKKIVGIFVCMLLITTALPATGIMSVLKNDKSKIAVLDPLDGGWLEEQDGVTILHLNGSNYDMGYQHGFLLKDEIHENMRAFMKYAEEISSYETLLDIWNTVEPYVPSCYIEEMKGIAAGADISFEDTAALYMVVLFIDMKCFTYAAWSNATIDGRLYHIRSLDFPLVIQDPVTGKYIQENSVLIVRNPENGLKSIAPSIAGSINFYQGINEKQVSIGVQVCWSYDQTLKGIPVKFKIQKILDTAKNVEEAIEILTFNRTLGWNFIVSDGKEGVGYVVEITANHTYVGTWDDPIEENYPFWAIEDVVRRTNFFIDPTMASTQRTFYNPSGIKGFLGLFSGEFFFPLWRKYKSMSNEIEKNWGEIDLNSSIYLLREVYTGKTDFLMFIFLFLGKNTILSDFHQWSVCPETGEFIISFADAERYSHESELHYFNIYDLLGIENS